MRIEEIETNREHINYAALNLAQGILKKNLEQMGKEAFLGNYYAAIGFYVKTWRSIDLRYLLAMLEHLNPEFQYSGKVEIGKVIVTDEHLLQKVMDGDRALLDKLDKNTPAAFKKYGILIA